MSVVTEGTCPVAMPFPEYRALWGHCPQDSVLGPSLYTLISQHQQSCIALRFPSFTAPFPVTKESDAATPLVKDQRLVLAFLWDSQVQTCGPHPF